MVAPFTLDVTWVTNRPGQDQRQTEVIDADRMKDSCRSYNNILSTYRSYFPQLRENVANEPLLEFMSEEGVWQPLQNERGCYEKLIHSVKKRRELILRNVNESAQDAASSYGPNGWDDEPNHSETKAALPPSYRSREHDVGGYSETGRRDPGEREWKGYPERNQNDDRLQGGYRDRPQRDFDDRGRSGYGYQDRAAYDDRDWAYGKKRNDDEQRGYGYGGGYGSGEGYGQKDTGGYRSRDNYSPRDRYGQKDFGQMDNYGPRDRYGQKDFGQMDNYGSRGRYEEKDFGQKDNYGSRGRYEEKDFGQKDNYGSRGRYEEKDFGQKDNYGSRGRYEEKDFGQKDNYGSRGRYEEKDFGQMDNYGSRGRYEENDAYHSKGSSRGGQGFGDRSRDIDRPPLEEVASKAFAPRSDAFTEERDASLEEALFNQLKLDAGIHFDKYDSIPINVSGEDVPQPAHTFQAMELHPHVLMNLQLAKYSKPTPIQRQGIPIVMKGRDMIGSAQTGSGKTAAFVAPVVSMCLQLDNSSLGREGPVGLILAPTRELSCQIFDVLRMFTYRTGVRPAVVYGGAPSGAQLQDLSRGCQILVGTPGRIKDFVERGRLSLRHVRFLVLDEADRMLDMGFEVQVRHLIEGCQMPPKDERQTLMFSATFPPSIQRLGADFLRNDYLFLSVGRVGGACDDVEQSVLQVQRKEKRSTLIRVLKEGGRGRYLIFVSTKREADALDDFLFRRGYPCTSIHGDRNQTDREAALASFKRGQTPILVATDVASRGLDIPHVNHVILYDLPSTIEDYVHRIGRTARAGNTGKATSFFTDTDSSMSSGLARVLKEAGQPVPEFLLNGSRGGGGGGYEDMYEMENDYRTDR